MRRFRRWFLDQIFREWVHVGICKWQKNRYSSESATIHCFESKHGRRRIEIVAGLGSSGSRWRERLKGSDLYQLRVYPWLNGAPDPDLPSYKDVVSKKDEFVSQLKGEKFPKVISSYSYND